MNVMGILIRVILLSIIPGTLTYLGQNDNILDYFESYEFFEGWNMQLIKHFATYSSILLVSGYLFFRHEIDLRKIATLRNQRKALMIDAKEIFLVAFSKGVLGVDDIHNLKIRIWIEKNDFKYKLHKTLRHIVKKRFRKLFVIKNIDGLSEIDITNNLTFAVGSSWQGMVGKCYNEKKIMYDADVQNSTSDYRINEYQRNKINGTRFCTVAPILDENENIISVISFDSNTKITIPSSKIKEFETIIMNYCQRLYENCPEIFNNKRE